MIRFADLSPHVVSPSTHLYLSLACGSTQALLLILWQHPHVSNLARPCDPVMRFLEHQASGLETTLN